MTTLQTVVRECKMSHPEELSNVVGHYLDGAKIIGAERFCGMVNIVLDLDKLPSEDSVTEAQRLLQQLGAHVERKYSASYKTSFFGDSLTIRDYTTLFAILERGFFERSLISVSHGVLPVRKLVQTNPYGYDSIMTPRAVVMVDGSMTPPIESGLDIIGGLYGSRQLTLI